MKIKNRLANRSIQPVQNMGIDQIGAFVVGAVSSVRNGNKLNVLFLLCQVLIKFCAADRRPGIFLTPKDQQGLGDFG